MKYIFELNLTLFHNFIFIFFYESTKLMTSYQEIEDRQTVQIK